MCLTKIEGPFGEILVMRIIKYIPGNAACRSRLDNKRRCLDLDGSSSISGSMVFAIEFSIMVIISLILIWKLRGGTQKSSPVY